METQKPGSSYLIGICLCVQEKAAAECVYNITATLIVINIINIDLIMLRNATLLNY